MTRIIRKESRPWILVVLSDSTGDLGERFVRAMVSQFPSENLLFRVFSFVRNTEDLRRIFRSLAGMCPVLYHTTLDPALKKEINMTAKKARWPVYDLTGGAMAVLEKALGKKYSPNAQALHHINSEYDKRIESVDFTVNHDDGLNPEHLRQADIVLVGVSRVSKTPTSVFLANKGYRVANVPMIKNLPLPDDVMRARGLKMVGLMIQPEKLRDIRLQRAKEDKIPGTIYTDLDAIREELAWAHSLMLEMGCPIIDVTHYAVEETAALVLKALHLR